MALSPLAVNSALALSTDEVWWILLKIDHPVLAGNPFYLINETKNQTIGGQEYLAYPFNIVLATDDGEQLPKVKLTIDNVDRALVQTIREINDTPTVDIALVLSSQPTVTEIQISGLVLREVTYNAFTITGTLYSDDLLNSRWPADKISLASGYLGLFR